MIWVQPSASFAGLLKTVALARLTPQKKALARAGAEKEKAMAQEGLAEFNEQNFDMNRDYLISVDEAGQHLPHVSREFSRYDRNQDGSLTWQELLGHDEWPSPRHP